MLNEEYGRQPFQHSLDPFTCGLSGTTYPCHEVRNRVTALAAGLSKELGFHPNKGNEWDKVICIYSLNTVSIRDWMVECGLMLRLDRYSYDDMGNTLSIRHIVARKRWIQ